MSALAIAPSLFDRPRGAPTLDDVIVDAWEGLAAHQAVSCPVCGGELVPQYGAHARPVAGRCSNCSTVIT